jgi:hypothetical protein
MLALYDPIGRQLFDNFVKYSKRHLRNINDIPLNRARYNYNDTVYSWVEMFDPEFGNTGQGRFNFFGQNVLYMSESKDNAIYEVKFHCEQKNANNLPKYIDVVSTKLIEKCELLDISMLDCPVFNICHNNASMEKKKIETAYYFPNFIAECCRHYKILGIIFLSSHNSTIKNYVFFENLHSWFEENHNVLHLEYNKA